MNLKIFTLVSSITLAAFLSPSAWAQNRAGGGARSHSVAMGPSQSSSARAPQTAMRSGGFQNGSSGRHWGNHGGDSRNHGRGCYPGYYPYSYSGFGYPYGFGYPFGYGFGYGYGYPYYGASASLYYNGYHPYRRYASSQSYASGGSVVSQVQQRLARAGYYRGRIDGIIGGGTRGAIRAWERAHGLRVDGQIDDRLLSTMDLA